MDPDKFPPFSEPGELVGTVSRRAEETLGIPAGIPVLCGGPDFIMSILGTGSTVPGRVCDRAGTSEGVNLCWSAPVRDKRLLCFPHVVRGSYNISAMLSSSGSALDWAGRALGQPKADIEAVVKEAQAAVPGADRLLFIPFLSPERFPIWDPNVRGTFLGLSLEHGRREMLRAVVESTAFAVRSVIAAMEDDGCQVSDLRVSGGLSRLPLWCQVRADVTGRKVLLPEQEDADLVGNACVGFLGLGEFETLSSAVDGMVRFQKIFLPNPANADTYDEMYEVFRRACDRLGEIYGKASR
jgi:xylulokinase